MQWGGAECLSLPHSLFMSTSVTVKIVTAFIIGGTVGMLVGQSFQISGENLMGTIIPLTTPRPTPPTPPRPCDPALCNRQTPVTCNGIIPFYTVYSCRVDGCVGVNHPVTDPDLCLPSR